jgi:bacitracin transport system permease protein
MKTLANLLYTELLKLKRSEMFLISMLGAAAAPILCFVGFVSFNQENPGDPILFKVAFSQTNFYVVLLIGLLLYGVITSYLFSREYTEDTLKSLLTIPVSRFNFVISKLILLFLWITILTLISWALTLILGLIGQFEGLTIKIMIDSILNYMIGGCLMFLLSTPIIFVTLLIKNYVPTVVFTIIIGMGNLIVWESKYRSLYPWSAAAVITYNNFPAEYPPEVAYLSILLTFIVGLAATLVYFMRANVH